MRFSLICSSLEINVHGIDREKRSIFRQLYCRFSCCRCSPAISWLIRPPLSLLGESVMFFSIILNLDSKSLRYQWTNNRVHSIFLGSFVDVTTKYQIFAWMTWSRNDLQAGGIVIDFLEVNYILRRRDILSKIYEIEFM